MNTPLRIRVLSGTGRHRGSDREDRILQLVWLAAHVPAAALLWWTAQSSPAPTPPTVATAQSPDVAQPGAL
ncbi:hypothetical protein AB0E27_41235 [Streptomyces sparsogenes]|uniref:hypothetical protein n=1 Tax=Streptomyces sparsogenes TaxID=67365 RepID=UPI0034074E3F